MYLNCQSNMEKFLVRGIEYNDRPNEIFIYSRGECDDCLVKPECDNDSAFSSFNICGSIDMLFGYSSIVKYIIKSEMSPYISKLSIKYGEIFSKGDHI